MADIYTSKAATSNPYLNFEGELSRGNSRAIRRAIARSTSLRVAKALSMRLGHLVPLPPPPIRPRRLVWFACRTSSNEGEDASHVNA
jgi:hypothetical protein